MYLSARHTLYSTVKVPKNIPLLSVEENTREAAGSPWCWWFKWGDLYYLDAELKEHCIKAFHTDEMKYPDDGDDDLFEDDRFVDDSDTEEEAPPSPPPKKTIAELRAERAAAKNLSAK